jgi:plasmid stability protein
MRNTGIVRFFCITVLPLSIIFGAFGQDSGTEESTVEELYLQNIEIMIIKEQASIVDRDMKLIALESIQEMVDDGKVDSDNLEIMNVLDYLSLEGIGTVVKEDNRQLNNFPEVRRRACNILGQVGGEESKEILTYVLRTDDEPMVLAEAAYALGEIGLNEASQVSEALAEAVLSQDALNPDNNFAFAALLAFKKLAEKNDGLRDNLSYKAIVQISQGNYIRTVKLKANEVIELLREYQ